jgi:hypothetical protein
METIYKIKKANKGIDLERMIPNFPDPRFYEIFV